MTKNAISKQVIEIERGGGEFADVRELVSGQRGRVVFDEGDPDHGVWSAGQVQGLIHDIPTCAELVGRMIAEAHKIIDERLGAMNATQVANGPSQ